MTTPDTPAAADDFTTAARRRAEQLVPLDGGEPSLIFRDRRLLVDMAVWARDHLAAQEETDAEVDAAYAAFHAHNGPRRGINEYNEVTCIECGYALSWPDAPMDGGKRAKRHAAREALAAARTARQEQNR